MVQNTREVTEPDFVGKLPVRPNFDKKCQIWPKNRLFQPFLKIENWKQAKMLDIMDGVPCILTICLGKLSFVQILGKTARKLSTNQIASFSKYYNF